MEKFQRFKVLLIPQIQWIVYNEHFIFHSLRYFFPASDTVWCNAIFRRSIRSNACTQVFVTQVSLYITSIFESFWVSGKNVVWGVVWVQIFESEEATKTMSVSSGTKGFFIASLLVIPSGFIFLFPTIEEEFWSLLAINFKSKVLSMHCQTV